MIKNSQSIKHNIIVRNVKGLALLETAIITMVIVPILVTLVGVLDLAYTKLTIKHIASEALSNIDTKTLRLRSGIKGSYLYARTYELDQLSRGVADQLAAEVTSSFGFNPQTAGSRFRVAAAFSIFAINEQTGEFKQTSNWGDPTSPNGQTNHPAFAQHTRGNALLSATADFREIFCYPATGPQAGSWPNSSTYPKVCPSGDPHRVLSDVPFILHPIPSGHQGTLRQVYYGGSHIYDNDTMKSDYLRHTAALGVSVSVDLGSRPAGVFLKTIQQGPPIIRATNVTSPRALL